MASGNLDVSLFRSPNGRIVLISVPKALPTTGDLSTLSEFCPDGRQHAQWLSHWVSLVAVASELVPRQVVYSALRLNLPYFAQLQQALVRRTGKLTEAGPAGTSAIE
jgi:hypothetical protein